MRKLLTFADLDGVDRTDLEQKYPVPVNPDVDGETMDVDKIHDVQRHIALADPGPHSLALGPRWKRIGVISPRRIRIIRFVIISLAILATVIACLLAIWTSLGIDIAWRALGSFGIITIATTVFIALNEGFAVNEPPVPP